MENGKKLKLNFCLGEINLKEIIAFIIIVASLMTDNILNYYQTKALPQIVKSNSKKIEANKKITDRIQTDIVRIQGSTENINILIDTMNKKQDLILNKLLK